MTEESRVSSVRFIAGNHQKAVELAEKKGQNVNQFINGLIEKEANVDSFIIEKVLEYQRKFGVSATDIERMAYGKFFAAMDAELEIYGPDHKMVFFKEKLASVLYENFKQQHIKDFEKSMIPVIVNAEKHGLKLDEQAKRIAVKYRIGEAWLESDEFKEEQEIRAEVERLKQQDEFDAELIKCQPKE